MEKLSQIGIATEPLSNLEGQTIPRALDFRAKLHQNSKLNAEQTIKALEIAELYPMKITEEKIASLEQKSLSSKQINAISGVKGQSFDYKWQLTEALAKESTSWQLKAENMENKAFNQKLATQLSLVQSEFHTGISENYLDIQN